MDGRLHFFLIAGLLVLLAASIVGWRRRKGSHPFQWMGRYGLFVVSVTSGELRLYRNRWAGPVAENDPNLGFTHRRWTHGPLFSNKRSKMDTTHFSWGGACYARGMNTETRTRYRVLSVPFWMPVLVAAGAVAATRLATGLASW